PHLPRAVRHPHHQIPAQILHPPHAFLRLARPGRHGFRRRHHGLPDGDQANGLRDRDRARPLDDCRMPAPVERPDDVHHRPDRRDDDAHLLRKPGPPHLRRPRDPHPQTARRRRRHEIAWDRRSVCVVCQHPCALMKIDRPRKAMVCPTYFPSKSLSAPPNSGKRNLNPAASGAAGNTLWLESRTSDISPNSNLSPNTGTGNMAGGGGTLASACVKSALVTGIGATPLSAPRTGFSTANWNIAARSARWIHDIHCLPSPSLPPSPRRNGGSMRCNAPPRASSTTPMRTRTTRIPNASAATASFSHAWQTSAR